MDKCSENLVDLRAIALSRGIRFSRSISARDLCNLINARNENDKRAPRNITDTFVLQKLLGKGRFGQVWLATEKATKTNYALKFMNNDIDEIEEKEVQRELSILSMLSKDGDCNPNIVCYYGQFQSSADLGSPKFYKVIIQTEFIEGTELKQFRDNWFAKNSKAPSAKVLYAIAIGLLKGLQYIHKHKVYHLDVKPSNIIVRKSTGESVLIDFGLACCEKAQTDCDCKTAVGFGTPGFMSPEYIENCLNDPESGKCGAVTREKTDIWAAGLVLLATIQNDDVGELLQQYYETKVAPHIRIGVVGKQEKEFVQHVINTCQSYLPTPPAAPLANSVNTKMLLSVIAQALTVNMKNRANATELLDLLIKE